MSGTDGPPPVSRLEAAREYLRRGLIPVPVAEGTKKPTMKKWQDFRPSEADLTKYFSSAGNIGILLGDASGGIAEVDLDVPEAIWLAPQHLVHTEAITGRPSALRSHWWYRSPGAQYASFKDPLTEEVIVELRTGRHQTLVGPSTHPDAGEPYDMLEGQMTEVDAGTLLAQVKRLFQAVLFLRYGQIPAQPQRETVSQKSSAYAPEPRIGTTTEARVKRASAYLAKLQPAISGQGGHSRTFYAARVVVHGFDLGVDAGFDLLWREYNQRCEPPWTEAELRHKVEDAATKPFDKSRGWLLERGENKTRLRSGTGASLPTSSTNQNRVELGRLSYDHLDAPLTDLGNAERFVARFGDQLRYCHSLNRWYVWDGGRWRVDSTGAVHAMAAKTARGIHVEASQSGDEHRRNALLKWSRQSEFLPRLEAMVAIARSMKPIAVEVSQLDLDPWTFNVLNGTIDLRTGKLISARSEDLITHQAPVTFDPHAKCPQFDLFMKQITRSNQDEVGFLLRWFGYCLTGDVSEQIMLVLFGPGANGKSVLADTVCGLMGEYAGLAAPNLLEESKVSEHPTAIADLKGKRLTIASETERATSLKLQFVKQVTGDAKLKGRFMRQDFFEFPRTNKLMLITNNMPRVGENSEAIWRRLKLMALNHVIPAEQRDTQLLAKLALERPGILNRLLDGCLSWQQGGLKTPPTLEVATMEFRENEDVLGRFYRSRCIAEAGACVSWKELWSAYLDWANEVGAPLASEGQLNRFLNARKHLSKPRRQEGDVTKVRTGLRLRIESAESQD